MRICIVQPALNQVSETFLRAHADGLRDVVAVVHQDRAGFPVLNGRSIGGSDWSGQFVRRVKRKLVGGTRVTPVDDAYVEVLRQLDAEVVLVEYGTMAVKLVTACERAGVPLVAHFHGYDASRVDILRRHADDYPRLFAAAAAVIAVSRPMAAKLRSLGCPEDKIVYNPCGVDAHAFSGAAPDMAPPHFVATGRLVGKKGPHLTLLAFARVLAQHPDARLRIIGVGELLSICQDVAAALGLSDAVTFLGAQPHAQVQEEMRRARAFVQHSVTAADGDSEGTPVAVLEAGASGLPVISTRHGGIQDVVIDGTTGLLVDERDVDGMARSMLALARDPAKAAVLGTNAFHHVRRHYSHEHSNGRVQRVLEAAAAAQPIGSLRQVLDREFPPINVRAPSGAVMPADD